MDSDIGAGGSGSFPHLRAVGITLAVIPLIIVASFPLLRLLERPFLRQLYALPFPEKNQGMFLQERAMLGDDVLPVYGSSELTTEMEDRPDEFFLRKPLGFQVCPIGRAGNTTFLMAEKVAALGDAVRDHKVAFILSPSWFRRLTVPESHVAGNFSPLQMIHLMQNPALPEDIRARFVRRLQEFPGALDEHPLLGMSVRDWGRQDGWARSTRLIMAPVLAAYDILLSWEDHLDTLSGVFNYNLFGRGRWREAPARINWRKVIRHAETEDSEKIDPDALPDPLPSGGSLDQEFLTNMTTSREWDDFALLLDSLKALKARALVISVPLPGLSNDKHGVSRAARDYYYHRVASMCAERGFPSDTFSDHDRDPGFLIGATSHLETKGWLYVNRLLDDFYHDKIKLPEKQPR